MVSFMNAEDGGNIVQVAHFTASWFCLLAAKSQSVPGPQLNG